jgi:hypothetical protein
MQNKARWTSDCYERRKRGAPELSFRDYLVQQNKSALHALNWKRKDVYARLVRSSGEAFLWGQYVRSSVYLVAAGLARPLVLMTRAAALLGNVARTRAGALRPPNGATAARTPDS